MIGERVEERTLGYESKAVMPRQQSGYAVAAVVVGGLSIGWSVLAALTEGRVLPFDSMKQSRIGSVAAVLGLALTAASYFQKGRRRTMSVVALAVAMCALVWGLLVMPL